MVLLERKILFLLLNGHSSAVVCVANFFLKFYGTIYDLHNLIHYIQATKLHILYYFYDY